MMLKKMMLAICLATVYTTHCAHAAVDFKNINGDPPWIGLNNILYNGKLPNTITINYINKKTYDNPSCNYVAPHYKLGSQQETICPNIQWDSIKTFKIPFTVSNNQNSEDPYYLSAIHPSGSNTQQGNTHADVNFKTPSDTKYPPQATMEFSPTYSGKPYSNGVKITHPMIDSGFCYIQLIGNVYKANINSMSECPSTKWVGLNQILKAGTPHGTWPRNFTTTYGTTENPESITCTYPLNLEATPDNCPTLQSASKDEHTILFEIPFTFNTYHLTKIIPAGDDEKTYATFTPPIPNNNEQVMMQFSPTNQPIGVSSAKPIYPNGVIIIHPSLDTYLCPTNSGTEKPVDNNWVNCTN